MTDPRLPYGKQFSPTQVDLRRILEVAKQAQPDREAAWVAIGAEFFETPGDKENERTKGMNAFLSMRHYQLVTTGSEYGLTDLAKDLLALESEDAVVGEFASHILLNLHGIQLIEVVDSLRSRAVSPTVALVASEMLALGVDPGGGSGENINPLRLWLEKAGVLKQRKWEIDDSRFKELVGATTESVSELVSLPPEESAVLRALATLTDPPPVDGNSLRKLAEMQTPGLSISMKSFAPRTLKALETAGWVTITKTTGGRGAKPHKVAPTDNFNEMVSTPLMDAVVEQVHLQDPASLRMPLTDLLAIVDDTKNNSNHKRGLALEGVCIQVVRVIGARFVGWRVRAIQTAGAEVDGEFQRSVHGLRS